MVGRLRAAPITVPLLVTVALFLAWVPLEAGQPLTRWAPGALLLLALLAVAALAAPLRWAAVPRAVRAAVLLLAAFAGWSLLSIAWAADRGAALEGADRTLLYLAAFALFALWPQRPATAAWVLGAWTLGLGVLATVTLLRVAGAAAPATMFLGDRLIEPAGYANAAAALWLMPLWAAVVLAAAPRVPWALRGLLAAAAVVLLDVALLSQSRGAVFSLPVCALLFVALVPGRLRHLAVLVPVLAAAVAAAPTVLDVGPAVIGVDLARAHAACDAVARTVLLLALAAGVVVALVAAFETRRPPAPATARRVRRAWAVAVVVAGVALAGGGLVVGGNPVQRVQDGWESFKGGYGDNAAGNRLVGGLGSNRYDFYRVSLDVFADHPLAGVGADNFFQDYLARGRSEETPRYPHDLALRTLAQTGIVGTLLLLAAVGAALAAGRRALRVDALAAAVAGGAAMGFVYWVVHGMTDWFWEWAGLGAPAFALLGLACSLAPRTAVAATPAPGHAARPARRRAALALGGAGVLATAALIAGPWLAEREVRGAARVFAARPFEAYDRLARAAALNPLSDRADLVRGSIALRYGDLPRAQAAFERALRRNPRGQYATVELGAIASAHGDAPRARRLLARAVALAPRDPTAREALAVVRSGGAVDLAALNRRILLSGQRFSAS